MAVLGVDGWRGAWVGALTYALLDNYSREWTPTVGDVLGPAQLFQAALRPECVQVVHDRLCAGFQSLIAIPVDQLMQFGDFGCARILQPITAALLPVFD